MIKKNIYIRQKQKLQDNFHESRKDIYYLSLTTHISNCKDFSSVYDLVFIKIILVVPNPIPCWHNEMKRTFRLGMSRINWILPATKWFSMLLTRFLLLGQVFWTLSWNYYFGYQYYYSIGWNHFLWTGISSSELEIPAEKKSFYLYQGLRVQVPELRRVFSLNITCPYL